MRIYTVKNLETAKVDSPLFKNVFQIIMEKFIPDDYQNCCPMCQRVFTSNHLNRRYCSKECKILANNKTARIARNLTKDINTTLARNREILRGYKSNEIVIVRTLLQKGFNFAFETHVAKSNDFKSGGAIITYCYDIGYQFLDDSKTKVKVIHS